eukprot:g2773.t1
MSKTVDVTTSYGKVRGFQATGGGMYTFRGVPFARLTGRFKRSLPPLPWRNVLECRTKGPTAVQPQMIPDSFGKAVKVGVQMAWKSIVGKNRKGENTGLRVPSVKGSDEGKCLNLNIYSPSLSEGRKVPVLVWFHGGAFMMGSGSDPIYQHKWGSKLATTTGCVLVTTNYRLGALGYLKVPGHDSNCGLWDQIMALRFVRDEIANFGGNAENVCIAGESAGGMSCGALLASKFAAPLFHKAICMSGAANNAISTEDANNLFRQYMHVVRKGRRVSSDLDDATVLANLSVSEILGAQVSLLTRSAMPFQPVVDGDILEDFPLLRVSSGCARDKKLIVGFNKEEWGLFSPLIPVVSSFQGSFSAFQKRVAGLLGPKRMAFVSTREDADVQSRELLRSLRVLEGRSAGAKILENRFFTSLVFAAPCFLLAEAFSRHNPTGCFVYRFDYTGSVLGAAHAVELPLLFGTHQRHFFLQYFSGARGSKIKTAKEISFLMMRSWETFMKTGHPQSSDKVVWPHFLGSGRGERRNVFIFDKKPRLDTTMLRSGDMLLPQLLDVVKKSKRPFGVTVGLSRKMLPQKSTQAEKGDENARGVSVRSRL